MCCARLNNEKVICFNSSAASLAQWVSRQPRGQSAATWVQVTYGPLQHVFPLLTLSLPLFCLFSLLYYLINANMPKKPLKDHLGPL